jgi:hypothetical protein
MRGVGWGAPLRDHLWRVNTTHESHLPTSWTTLYELSKAKPALLCTMAAPMSGAPLAPRSGTQTAEPATHDPYCLCDSAEGKDTDVEASADAVGSREMSRCRRRARPLRMVARPRRRALLRCPRRSRAIHRVGTSAGGRRPARRRRTYSTEHQAAACRAKR